MPYCAAFAVMQRHQIVAAIMLRPSQRLLVGVVSADIQQRSRELENRQ
jgi:hypothetical protein